MKTGHSLFDGQPTPSHLSTIEQEIGQLTHPTIYIHVPFCRTHCDFCTFPTTLFITLLGDKYIAALDHQLGYIRDHYPHIDMSKVYIGGGTPATLLPELTALVKKYDLGTAELSIEAHPQDFVHMTDEELSDMSGSFTRVSIGLQTLNPALLEPMNRSNGHRPLDYIKRVVDTGMLVNVDLIHGIEGQTLESFTDDLHALIALGVKQITCYPLMGKATATPPLVAEDAFYRAMLGIFDENGYTPLTPWCFTTCPEKGHGEYISTRNNDSREQILALGVGGISKIGNIFAINRFNLRAYAEAVAHDELPILSTRKLTAFQEAQYFLLTALFSMCVDTQELTGKFIIDLFIKIELRVLKLLGVVQTDKEHRHRYTLTEQGMFYMSKAMSSFYAGLGQYRQPHNQTISK